ncbi:hypothetical protein QAD02_020816 [Eretmocerus hayati]|uniref:Uncharacterized protein n=1 Tax=Eretmocerus hayati TaxID=131215 RepID=A0ACC2PPI1_9HYME|nr:hypothetical protein QAD02_020816 [Eretmocerus hayati]
MTQDSGAPGCSTPGPLAEPYRSLHTDLLGALRSRASGTLLDLVTYGFSLRKFASEGSEDAAVSLYHFPERLLVLLGKSVMDLAPFDDCHAGRVIELDYRDRNPRGSAYAEHIAGQVNYGLFPLQPG